MKQYELTLSEEEVRFLNELLKERLEMYEEAFVTNRINIAVTENILDKLEARKEVK